MHPVHGGEIMHRRRTEVGEARFGKAAQDMVHALGLLEHRHHAVVHEFFCTRMATMVIAIDDLHRRALTP